MDRGQEGSPPTPEVRTDGGGRAVDTMGRMIPGAEASPDKTGTSVEEQRAASETPEQPNDSENTSPSSTKPPETGDTSAEVPASADASGAEPKTKETFSMWGDKLTEAIGKMLESFQGFFGKFSESISGIFEKKKGKSKTSTDTAESAPESAEPVPAGNDEYKEISEKNDLAENRLTECIIKEVEVPGVGRMLVNTPKNLNEFKDSDGDVIKPLICMHFHGNGGQGADVQTVWGQVAKMRKKNQPVVMAFVIDSKQRLDSNQVGNWGAFVNPQNRAAEKIMKVASKVSGVGIDKNITVSGFSGGAYAIGRLLQQVKGTWLEGHIRSIATYDAIYDADQKHREFVRAELAHFAKDPSRKLIVHYTSHLNNSKADLEKKIREAREVGPDDPLPGVEFISNTGSHRGTMAMMSGDVGATTVA